jgi:hypothetical protein
MKFTAMLFVLAIIYAIAVQPAAAKDVHMLYPYKCWKIDEPGWPPELQSATIDQFWVFSTSADAVITDPTRPPLVIGSNSTEDWTISLTTTDPWGNTMDYTGIKFILNPGGKYFDSHDPYSAFTHATMATDQEQYLIDIWHDADGYHTSSGYPAHIWDSPVPAELITPREIAQYVWNQTMVPEPSTLALLAIGALGLTLKKKTR